MRTIARGKYDKLMTLDLDCRKKSLKKARSRVKKFAARHGFSSDAEDIALAVQEALKNVIQHANPPDHNMHVELRATAERILVKVVDRGRGFDVIAADRGPVSSLSLHGRGIQLMRGLMDELKIESDGGGTVVTMEKSRSGRHSAYPAEGGA
jgi:anti-sigma regulatory factor (Ser/Thr protein kinase)